MSKKTFIGRMVITEKGGPGSGFRGHGGRPGRRGGSAPKPQMSSIGSTSVNLLSEDMRDPKKLKTITGMDKKQIASMFSFPGTKAEIEVKYGPTTGTVVVEANFVDPTDTSHSLAFAETNLYNTDDYGKPGFSASVMDVVDHTEGGLGQLALESMSDKMQDVLGNAGYTDVDTDFTQA